MNRIQFVLILGIAIIFLIFGIVTVVNNDSLKQSYQETQEEIINIKSENISNNTVSTNYTIGYHANEKIINIIIINERCIVHEILQPCPLISYTCHTIYYNKENPNNYVYELSVSLNHIIFFTIATVLLVYILLDYIYEKRNVIQFRRLLNQIENNQPVKEKIDAHEKNKGNELEDYMYTYPFCPHFDKEKKEEKSTTNSQYISSINTSTLHINETHKMCVICLVDYEEGQVIYCLRCKHMFHFECLQQAIQIKPTCPACKRVVIRLK